ncbi:Pre-mRNA-processing factor 17 [Coccomyxa sp. Obi]|nr:Pre-mRNA-processing factor 17 [Coccomyxa sp. Obi]
MDLIARYSDDGEALSHDEEEAVPAVSLKLVSAAPEVDTTGLALMDNTVVPAAAKRHLQDATARQVMVNLPYEEMHAPVVGPAHPYQKDGIAAGMKNHRTGHVEDYNMHSFHFDDQYNTFHSYSYAVAPGGQGVVGDEEAFAEKKGESVYTMAGQAKRRKTTAERRAEEEQKKAERGEADPDEPWVLQVRQPWADVEVKAAQPTPEQMEWLEKEGFIKDEEEEEEGDGEEGGGEKKKRRKGKQVAAVKIQEKSHFHGKEERNPVTGRSWVDPPKDKKKENEYCYLPKKWIHTWSGHTKGVNAIRFFPGSGHLLLSAGLDGKVKIWDVYGNGKCMRTYMGFSKGVKDISFSNDGRKFLSTSYDKVVKLWDTETGQVLQTLGEGKMFFTARFHPSDDKQNVIMGGCADKKIYQWDSDTGDLVQEYNYHLGAVNTVTFVDEGRRFVSTSDDKTIRVWEFGIPVQIKYIADPSLHSIPAVAVHPNSQWLIGTSLDNQIVTYAARDRFRQNRKKFFKGHTVAGYACQPNFSPDGRYVMSGDGEGRLWFWDWKTCKPYRTIKAHESVCIDAEWHPLESSKVATCSWDGQIKYWD